MPPFLSWSELNTNEKYSHLFTPEVLNGPEVKKPNEKKNCKGFQNNH